MEKISARLEGRTDGVGGARGLASLLSLPDMSLQAMPRVGGLVLVDYLGVTVGGTVARVDRDGRRSRSTPMTARR